MDCDIEAGTESPTKLDDRNPDYGASCESEVPKLSHGLDTGEAKRLQDKYGPNRLPEKNVPKWYQFLQLFWQPMPIMIWIAAAIELAIENYVDMFILLLIQFANGGIAFYEINKAGDAVAALKASLRPHATVKRDNIWRTVDASVLVPGDLVLLASGSHVPADCIINAGSLKLDQAQLTGESMPVSMTTMGRPLMGSTVVQGEVEATVAFTGANTFFGKTASLLGDKGEQSNLNLMLMDIMVVLVSISLTLCLAVFIYLMQRATVVESLEFTVVLMVASIPLAIEIVTTTTLAVGSEELSRSGAIVTRLSAIEDMAGMSILCSDKTGTLTMNKMVIQDSTPVFSIGETQYSILRYAAMATRWDEPPKDALDTLTLGSADVASLRGLQVLNHLPFDPTVKRTESTLRDPATGQVFKVSKGAPAAITGLMNRERESDRNMIRSVEQHVLELSARGIRALAVARTNEQGDWCMLGLLTFLDPPRSDTVETLRVAMQYGIAVKMITGDHLLIAKETARRLEMGTYILPSDGLPVLDPTTGAKPTDLITSVGELVLGADGFAEVFPEHKYLIVETLRELGYKVGMTGDGVNDAPALKRADVGIAVGGSTDAARAAADIVLTEPGLSAIVDGVVIARRIFVRIRNFITYRIAATLQLLLFFFVAVFVYQPSAYEPKSQDIHGYTDVRPWPAYFHMPVLMLMLITLLNDGTLIAIGYDNVTAHKYPEKWNLNVLFVVGTVLALVACVSSLLLLHLSLDSWNEGSIYQLCGIGGLSYGQITTSIYLKVSISDFLTLFSSRTGDDWFWATRPAPVLLGAGCFALGCSTLFACNWPETYPDRIYTLGLDHRRPYVLSFYIWIYCLVWWFVQDAAKVYTWSLLKRYNAFGINDSAMLPGVLEKNTFLDEEEEFDENGKPS
jgi:H+-transporting ATPase